MVQNEQETTGFSMIFMFFSLFFLIFHGFSCAFGSSGTFLGPRWPSDSWRHGLRLIESRGAHPSAAAGHQGLPMRRGGDAGLARGP